MSGPKVILPKEFGYDVNTEGKEPFKKLWAACKFSILGTAATAGHVAIRSSSDLTSTFAYCGRHLVLWIGVTTAFTTTVLFLTNVRKKNDPWNYFWGANASTALYYSITKKTGASCLIGIIGSIGAALLKAGHLRGYDPFDYSTTRIDKCTIGVVYENSPDVRYLKEN